MTELLFKWLLVGMPLAFITLCWMLPEIVVIWRRSPRFGPLQDGALMFVALAALFVFLTVAWPLAAVASIRRALKL